MSLSLSAKSVAATSRAPLSPSFAPRKLGFTNDEMNELQTPQTSSRTRSVTNLGSNQNKENGPPTPMSTAKDSQYKFWLQHNGFVDIFRNPKVLAAIIKALRLYSEEVMHKVEGVLGQNNKLHQWRVEVGEPALETIERYKLIEAELKSAQSSLNALYEAKKTECEQSKNDLNLLKLRIKEQLSPRIVEYEALMKQNGTLMHQMDRQKTENNNLKETLLLQKEEYELQIQQLKDSLRDTKSEQTTQQAQELPPQFLDRKNKSQFDWDFAMDDDEEEEEEEIPPPPQPQPPQREDEFKKYCDMVDKSLRILITKIENMNNGQTKTVQSITHSLKKHFSSNIQQQTSEFAKLNQSLLKVHEKQLGLLDMKSTMTSLYSSLNTSLS
eukprot:108817_1